MEIVIEVHRKGDIGLNVASPPYPINRHSDGKNYFVVKNLNLLTKSNWLTVSQLEQYVFCIKITYLRSLGFKGDEIN